MRILAFLLALCLTGPAWANCDGSTVLYPLTSHVLNLQNSSAQWSGQMPSQTYCARVYSEVLSYLTIAQTTATAPAASSDLPMPAGHVEYFKVYSGQYVGVIRDSSGGTVTITEMTE